jgi:hypothetical protein
MLVAGMVTMAAVMVKIPMGHSEGDPTSFGLQMAYGLTTLSVLLLS